MRSRTSWKPYKRITSFKELDKAIAIDNTQHNKYQDFVDNAVDTHLVPPLSKKAKVGAGSSSTSVTSFGVTSVDVPAAGATAAMAMTAGSPDTSPKQQRRPFKFPDGLSYLITAEEYEKRAGIRKKNTKDDDDE